MIEQRPPELSHLLGHSEWLRRLARGLVADGTTADDLVQETWLAALRNPPDPDRPARPWLAGVLRNLVRMRARTEARRAHRQERAARREQEPPSTERVERGEIEERLSDLVLELGEPYRSTVLMHYFHGQTAVEIARREGVSAGTVRWRLWRGLEELRGRLQNAPDQGRNWLPALVAFVKESEPAPAPAALSPLAGALGWKLGAGVVLAAVAGGLALRAFADATELDLADAGALEPARVEERAQLARAGAPRAVPGARGALAAPTVQLAEGLRVVEHDGRPAAGWHALVASGGGEFVPLVTDADGRLPADALAPGASLFLGRPGAPIELAVLTPDALRGELRLERGSVVSGRVLVDGRAPAAPLEIYLTTDRPLHEDELHELGLDAQVLWAEVRQGRRVRVVTEADGTFSFHGLDGGWSGLVVLPFGYELAGEPSRANDGRTRQPYDAGRTTPALHFPRPVTGLVIELERRPHLRGRVVAASDGAPIPGALLCWHGREGERLGHPVDVVADAHGRFEVGVAAGADDGGLLEYWDASGAGGRSRKVLAAEIASDLELGDLAVGSERRVSFEVRDPEGAPIAGAVASGEGIRRPSDPTDADGRGVLEGLAPSVETFEVKAHGYVARRFELPSGPRASVAVELEPANALRVLVAGADGAPLAEVVLRARGDGALFVPGMEPRQVAGAGRDFRGQKLRSRVEPGAREVELAPASDGSVALEGLRTGTGIRLELLDGTGRVVLERELAALARGERRELSLRVERALGSLEGQVESAGDGVPIVGAIVRATDPEGGVAKVRVGRDGRFRILSISSDELDVVVTKPGFDPLELGTLPVTRGGAPLRIVLARVDER